MSARCWIVATPEGVSRGVGCVADGVEVTPSGALLFYNASMRRDAVQIVAPDVWAGCCVSVVEDEQ